MSEVKPRRVLCCVRIFHRKKKQREALVVTPPESTEATPATEQSTNPTEPPTTQPATLGSTHSNVDQKEETPPGDPTTQNASTLTNVVHSDAGETPAATDAAEAAIDAGQTQDPEPGTLEEDETDLKEDNNSKVIKLDEDARPVSLFIQKGINEAENGEEDKAEDLESEESDQENINEPPSNPPESADQIKPDPGLERGSLAASVGKSSATQDAIPPVMEVTEVPEQVENANAASAAETIVEHLPVPTDENSLQVPETPVEPVNVSSTQGEDDDDAANKPTTPVAGESEQETAEDDSDDSELLIDPLKEDPASETLEPQTAAAAAVEELDGKADGAQSEEVGKEELEEELNGDAPAPATSSSSLSGEIEGVDDYDEEMVEEEEEDTFDLSTPTTFSKQSSETTKPKKDRRKSFLFALPNKN